MATANLTTPPNAMRPENPALWLKPDEPLMAEGYDWSWCYVVYRGIEGFPGYRVGSNGTVWSRRRDNARTGLSKAWSRLKGTSNNGYRTVRLFRGDGVWHQRWVHRLVLEAFVGARPEGKEACHAPDPTRSNNNLWNLRWGTHAANILDLKEHRERNGISRPEPQKIGEESHFAKLREADVLAIRQMAYEGATNVEISQKFGLYLTHVSLILNGRSWGHLDPEGIQALKRRRREMSSKGKARPRRGATRLTESDVLEIRRLRREGAKTRTICEQFKITETVALSIFNRRTWGYLP